MTRPYTIASYRPAHKAQVAALQTHLWSPESSWTLRHFEWKYEANPYLPEPIIYLAFCGDELVGMRGFYGARWEAGSSGEAWSVPVADDFVIVPEHRNRGLVTLIMDAAFAGLAALGYRYVFNLSGGQVTVMGSLATGWKSAGPLEPIGLEWGSGWPRRAREALRDRRFLWRLSESPLLRSPREHWPFGRLDRVARHRATGSLSVEREPRVDEMSELVRRLGHDGRIRHRRDSEFLAWRYRNPLARYRFLYSGKDRLEGYLVLRAPHAAAHGESTVKIVDLEASDAGVRAELLNGAVELGRFSAIFAWAATLAAEARTQFSARGFQAVDLNRRARGSPCVLVRAVAPHLVSAPWVLSDRCLTDLADWDMRMVYTAI